MGKLEGGETNLVVVETHPVQYHASIYRAVQSQFGIPVTAIYGSDFIAAGYLDPEFGVAFSWEEPDQSVLEAVLSGGDRRLGRAIHRAWQLGARFDAWSEGYDWSRWRRALEESGLDPSFYAHREKGLFEAFPWSHIDVGVTAAYLRGEWLRTQRGETTSDCAPHKGPCHVCGMQNLGAETCLAKLDELIGLRARGRRSEALRLTP